MNMDHNASTNPLSCMNAMDCPNLKYECFTESIVEPVGQCDCNRSYALWGDECQFMNPSVLVAEVLLIIMYSYSLVRCVLIFYERRKASRISLNAFTTTLGQLSTGCAFALCYKILNLLIIRNILPGTIAWHFGIRSILMLALVFMVGATLNISMLWLEIAANSRLTSQSNLKRHRNTLKFVIFCHLTMTVIILAWTKEPSYAMLMQIFFQFGIGISYLCGSRSLIQVLQQRGGHSMQFDIQTKRYTEKIKNASLQIAFDSFLFVVCIILTTMLTAFNSNIMWLDVTSTFGSFFFMNHLGFVLVWYLTQDNMLSWSFLKHQLDRLICRKVAIHPEVSASHQVQIHPVSEAPNA